MFLQKPSRMSEYVLADLYGYSAKQLRRIAHIAKKNVDCVFSALSTPVSYCRINRIRNHTS